MPIYSYQCTKCYQVFDQLKSVADRDIQYCPYCGAYCNRIVELNTFQLKGKGWAKDGYSKE